MLFCQSLIAHSQEKSRLLRDEESAWDHLTEFERQRQELVNQLTAAHQQITALVPATEELASLCVKERDARRDAKEAGQKLIDLLERKHQDDNTA